jgi:phosphohistidine phosphatase SixA
LLANTKEIELLQEGGKVVFIRHAYAPGGGDPSNFLLNNCDTQRNLNKDGIDQSIMIGAIFRNYQIPIDQVLSSEWCRCLDTAKYAFGDFDIWSALNSTFSGIFKKNHSKQMSDLRKYLTNWDDEQGNLILVTHYVIIEGALDYYSDSGEIVISNKHLEVLGNINTKY